MYYVYFIREVLTEKDEGFWNIKIGVSINVRVRLKELQVGNSRKLEEMFSIPFPSRNDAQKAETFLHKKHRRKRLCGEWFKNTISYKKMGKLVDGYFVDNNLTEIKFVDFEAILMSKKKLKKYTRIKNREKRQSLF